MRYLRLLFVVLFSFLLCACGQASVRRGNTLVYGCRECTRINPAMDEHGEINLLLFDGLTAHDAENQIVPRLARSWEFDRETCTYTFYLEENVTWHDDTPFTSRDVRFTVEAIMNPENASENAADFRDVLEILTPDAYTIQFRLLAPNTAFLEAVTMSILPSHLLEGEDMQTSDFFCHPVGTGPYRLAAWEAGQSITLVRNESYFRGAAQIDTIIFKMIPDDNVRALQMQSGDLDLALLTPKDAERFISNTGYTVYSMQTADYRGILFNFHNPYWQENRDIIPAICCAIDRQTIVDAVLLGHGEAGYGPLQKNEWFSPAAERYEYDPQRAENILLAAGCVRGKNGYYTRNGEEVGFVLSVSAGDQVRLDIAQAAAQQLAEIGIDCTVEIPAQIDWYGQMAYLIGWGSPFDADVHTYKVFGADQGANYSGYSNARVDEALTRARQSEDPAVRAKAYAEFQVALAEDPAYAFICYLDADYVAVSALQGISEDLILGHHGSGIFYNITEWTLER